MSDIWFATINFFFICHFIEKLSFIDHYIKTLSLHVQICIFLTGFEVW